MNKLLDYIRRLSPLTIMLVSLVLGLIIGLVVLGWYVFPVRWYDVDPADLRLEHRKDYLLMAADSYALTDDVEQARYRLNALKGQRWSDGDIAATLNGLIDERAAQGDMAAADRVAVLAGLQVATPAPTVTPAPSVTDRLRTPLGMGLALGTALLLIVLVGILWMRRKAKAEPFPPRRKSLAKRFRMRREPLAEAGKDRPVSEPQPSGDIGVMEIGLAREAPGVSTTEEPPSVGEPGLGPEVGAPGLVVEPGIPAETVRGKALGQFDSEYVMGKAGFDASFGIESPEGEFLGECGMGITDVIGEEDPQRVSAFEVWLFDKGDIRTVSKVLVSEYAYRDQAVRAKLSAKGQLVVARPGESVELETVSLRMVAQIVASEYGESEDLPPGSFFSRLKVRLMPAMR